MAPEVSPDLISKVTDAVLEEVRDWQSRPLEPVYPAVFFDALRIKIRDVGTVKNKAVHSRMISARQTCFCGALRSWMRALSRPISADETESDFPARIPQTLTSRKRRESRAGLKCQVRSTS